MLGLKDAQRIGLNACIDRIGRDFVTRFKDQSTSACGECDEGVFCFVGVDDQPWGPNTSGLIVLDDTTQFPYQASCTVSLQDGTVGFLECVLPPTV